MACRIPPSSAGLPCCILAQEMDADYVVFGDYTSDGQTLTVNARLLRVNPVCLLPDGPGNRRAASLMDLHTRLVWRCWAICDHGYPLDFSQFSKLQRPLGLAAFEQYIRGLLANDDEARLRDLKEAARLEPDWPEPAFALGEFYFQKNDCASALALVREIPASDPQGAGSYVCFWRLPFAPGPAGSKPKKFSMTSQEHSNDNVVSGADLPGDSE